MGRRTPAFVAWGMAAAAVALMLASLALRVAHADPTLSVEAASRAVMLAFAGTGLVVALARRSNPIGWLLIAIALVDGTERFANSLVVNEPSLVSAQPAVAAFVVVAGPASSLIFLWLILIAALFPSGRAATNRGLLTAGVSGVLCLGWIALLVVREGPIQEAGGQPNPFGFLLLPEGSFEALATLFFVSQLLLLAAAAGSLVIRSRRSRGIERLQMKWLAASMALLASFLGVFSAVAVIGELFGARLEPGSPFEAALGLLFWAVVLGLPVSIAIAILRYRLYDIDVLINRALVYSALTAMLAAAYVGSVLLLQAVLRPFTAENEIAVAVSTLAVVALFQPLRRRIQDVVDRRFYRSRYDAQRTLDAFTARLRDEVDLDAVRMDLLDAIASSVQPVHAAVWLRRSEGSR